MKKTKRNRAEKAPRKRTDSRRCDVAPRSAWIAKAKRMPKPSQAIVAGSYRIFFGKKIWSMSSISEHGWQPWIDEDRTHWMAIPKPPRTSSPNNPVQGQPAKTIAQLKL